jgi:hypothetical protein
VTPAPAVELRYVVYPWVVDCAVLRGAGWHPSFSNTEALAVLLAGRAGHHAVVGRRIARKDAAITAAGAAGTAAAVIGAAAIVRHARKKSNP